MSITRKMKNQLDKLYCYKQYITEKEVRRLKKMNPPQFELMTVCSLIAGYVKIEASIFKLDGKIQLGYDVFVKDTPDASEWICYDSPTDEVIPEYSFHWNGTSNKIFLFEAPIDMLSYISINPHGWQQHTYAASCSVADRVLFQCLKDNPNITEIYLCLDNDEAGQNASKRISDKLFTLPLHTKYHYLHF